MAVCETCGNDYHDSFEVWMANRTHVFDSFECAIEKLAPRCGNCGVRIVGHGVEVETDLYCCAHCAREDGSEGAVDRV